MPFYPEVVLLHHLHCKNAPHLIISVCNFLVTVQLSVHLDFLPYYGIAPDLIPLAIKKSDAGS